MKKKINRVYCTILLYLEIECFLKIYINKSLILLLAFAIMLNSVNLYGQESQNTINGIPSYNFVASNGTFSYLGSGTNIPSIQADDALSSAIPIGFNFNVSCKVYKTVYASSNGTLSFNNTDMGANNINTGTGTNVFAAPLWDDLNGNSGNATYITSGIAPNRVFTMEWKNWKWNYSATSPSISFQVKLYEGSNKIEYLYNQEIGSLVEPSASIGFFDGINNLNYWLNSSSSSPTVASIGSATIATKPNNGQKYTFNNTSDCTITQCFGRTLINSTGGTNSTNGLGLEFTGAGNFQIKINGKSQIFDPNSNILPGTSNPYAVPGTTHGMALYIGGSYFVSGTLVGSTGSSTKLKVVSNTCQSAVGPDGGTQKNIVVLSAIKNGLTYLLTLTYTYIYPNNYFNIDYKVTIPDGNTQVVQLAHGWDTFLSGGDSGPGFLNGKAPNYTMGVVKQSNYEAFRYVSGIPWSGYFSAGYGLLNGDLGADGQFNNTIDPSTSTDNGIGISMSFGSTPGTFHSNSNIIFSCNVPSTPPVVNTSTVNACPSIGINLNNYINSQALAPGVSVVWVDDSNNVVSNPTLVTAAGVYYAIYYDSFTSCYSNVSAGLTVTANSCNNTCYKPAVTTGTVLDTKFGITALGRAGANNDNWPMVRKGAWMALEAKTKGFVINRLTDAQISSLPSANLVEGMAVYNITKDCLQINIDGTATGWKCYNTQACPD